MKSRIQLVLLMVLVPAVIGLVTAVVLLARMDHEPSSTAPSDDHGTSTSFASITTSSESGNAPLVVSFRAVDLGHAMFGAVTKYGWDFGDGANAEGFTAEYTYTRKGKYTVTLTIFYQDGTQQVATKTIEVK